MTTARLELGLPWAISPSKLLEIQRIYSAHLVGEKIDIKRIEAEIGRPLANKPEPYWIENGIAVIPIEGVIFKRANLFTQISGGASAELIGKDFRSALSNPLVKGIVLAIDSPGGQVDGIQELSNLIFISRMTKPIMAYTDGMMASAAYWIGSAAEKIFISGDTNQVGSIGVVAQHVDISEAEKKAGIKTTEIVAGKYKRIASRHAPLTEEGKVSIQEAVDYIYSAFVNDVARNRGVSEEKALSMADGKVFIGKQTINAGLTDGVSSLESMTVALSNGSRPLTMAELDECLRVAAEGLKKPKPKTAEEVRETARIQLAVEEKLEGDKEAGLSADEQMQILIGRKMESNKSLSYSNAFVQVSKENPELAAKVKAEMDSLRKSHSLS